jgi:hypothetical protein
VFTAHIGDQCVAGMAVANANPYFDEFMMVDGCVKFVEHGIGQSGVSNNDDWL